MILVFGGDGQLGRELVRAASLTNVPLSAFGRSAADIADRTAVERALSEVQASVVVNAAAYTKVDQAESQASAAKRSNTLGPEVVASVCASAGIPLVHISTDYVFDGKKEGSYSEADSIAPIGVYACTKAEGEGAVRSRSSKHIILRTAWIYGEFGNNFLKTMVRLAQQRDELRVVADQRGCPTSTIDLASAIVRIAPRLIAGDAPWGTYHFAGEGVTTWHGFAERIVAAQAPITNRNPRVVPITSAEYPTAVRRPANTVLDCSRFAQTFSFRARPWGERVDDITVRVVRNCVRAPGMTV